MMIDSMKEISGITNQMDKVCTSYFYFFCFIVYVMLHRDGSRYEGEFKDSKLNGYGKKEVFFFMIY